MSLGNNSIQFLNHPQYPQSFTPVKIPKQKKFVYNNYRLVINSTDRDRSIYRNPNEFKLQLPRRYRNIAMVECGLIILPNFSNSEKYFLIQVQELNDGPYDSLDPNLSKAIAVVPNRNGLNNYNYILETPGDTSYIKNYIKKFVDTPLASLSTFTLKIKKPDGTLINFGNDLLPYDKEYFFSEGYVNTTTPINAACLSITSNDHDLSCSIKADNNSAYNNSADNNSDVVNIYDSTITYDSILANMSLKRITKSFPDLDGSYFKLYVQDNNIFSIELSPTVKDEINTDNYPNWVLGGKWKRAKHTDGYYSRVKISSVSINDKTIIVETNDDHHLQEYDRIYIDNIISTPKTRWFKNYHVVTEIISNNEFKLHTQNITSDDVTSNLLLNYEYLKQDEPESTNITILDTSYSIQIIEDSFAYRSRGDDIIKTDLFGNILQTYSSIYGGTIILFSILKTDTNTLLCIVTGPDRQYLKVFNDTDLSNPIWKKTISKISDITSYSYSDNGTTHYRLVTTSGWYGYSGSDKFFNALDGDERYDFPINHTGLSLDHYFDVSQNKEYIIIGHAVGLTIRDGTLPTTILKNIDMNPTTNNEWDTGVSYLIDNTGTEEIIYIITSQNVPGSWITIRYYIWIANNNSTKPLYGVQDLHGYSSGADITYGTAAAKTTNQSLGFGCGQFNFIDIFDITDGSNIQTISIPQYAIKIDAISNLDGTITLVAVLNSREVYYWSIADDNDNNRITVNQIHYTQEYEDTLYINIKESNGNLSRDMHHIVDNTSKGNLSRDMCDIVDIADNTSYGYLQKYGDPDPTIQNLFIFNINSREEDDEHVRSENIAYGNL